MMTYMKNLNTSQLTIEPIQDTWEIRGDVATWYINFKLKFASLSIQEINTWYSKAVAEILASFASLGRVWHISFKSNTKSQTNEKNLGWKLGIEYENYVQEIIKSIQKFPDAIEQLKISFDLSVFVRTKESPNKPVRVWVRNLAHLLICGGKEHEKYADPVTYIYMDNTLFCPVSIYEEDNSELYSLNQPLLEKILHNWEKVFGAINEFDGLEGIYKYGFLPEDKWNKS
jgi:hypothetical protein